MPGGYIYRLALSENQKGAFQADPDSLALVYPLTPRGQCWTSPSRRTGRPSSSPPARGGPHLRRGGHRRHDLPPGLSLPRRACTPSTGRTAPGQTRPPPTRPAPAHRPADPGEGFLLAVGPETFTCFLQDAGGAYQSAWSAPHPGGLPPRPRCNAQGAWNGRSWPWAALTGSTGAQACPCGCIYAHGAPPLPGGLRHQPEPGLRAVRNPAQRAETGLGPLPHRPVGLAGPGSHLDLAVLKTAPRETPRRSLRRGCWSTFVGLLSGPSPEPGR